MTRSGGTIALQDMAKAVGRFFFDPSDGVGTHPSGLSSGQPVRPPSGRVKAGLSFAP